MRIFPAIDLFGGKAVRLFKGDYNKMTVYSDNPVKVGLDFKESGAKFMHVVDLEGAKTGDTPNFETVKSLCSLGLFTEVGGGIRNMATINKYVDVGVSRVILGTAAVTDRKFLVEAVKTYGDKIAVGVDIKDQLVAIKGWTEKSDLNAIDFCKDLEEIGVTTIICTDISKDGAMKGTNVDLYKELSKKTKLNIIASGGVSDIEDIKRLKGCNLYGAIIGKAYYTGAISIKKAIEVSK